MFFGFTVKIRTGRCILCRNIITISLPASLRYLLCCLLAAGLFWRPGGAAAQVLAADSVPPADWHLALDEEFNASGDSSTLAARWRFAYPWGPTPGGLEGEYYTGTEVHVRGGSLLLTAHRLPRPRTVQHGRELLHLPYTSGMVYGRHPGPDSLRPAPCPPNEGLSYGWFELRCRLPRDAGSFPAFWLYGPPGRVGRGGG